MSGGPVLDREVGGIIGIISERYITESDVDKHLSFAIPVSTTIAIFPEIVKRNHGLIKINQFMGQIGQRGVLYERFESLYVAPLVYPELEKNSKIRIVF